MGIGEVAALLGVGLAAGTINTVVGSGTLVTFPTLLAFGYSPVVANVTNTVGLVPGSAAGIHGYRAEIAEFRAVGGRRLLRLATASFLGATLGALLLFLLPAAAFKAIVPALIALALVLIIVQPRLSKRIAARRAARSDADADADAGADADAAGADSADTADTAPAPRRGGWGVLLAVFGTGVYGGYFGAAQGVLLMAVLGLTYDDRLQVVNGVKNVLACVVNAVAAVVFIIVGAFGLGGPEHPAVRWGAALAIAVGAVAGGRIGASAGRRLPPRVLRGLIITVGLAAIASMVL